MLARDRGLHPLVRRLVPPAVHLLYTCCTPAARRQARKAAAKSRLDSKAKGKGTPQRAGSAGGRDKGKGGGRAAPTRVGYADDAMHGEAAEATQPKRTTSVTSASGAAAGGGARGRPAHDLRTLATQSARGCNPTCAGCISTASPPHLRSISSASPPYLHVAAGGGEREAREAGAPAAETSRARGRREAETRLKEALEPLATVRPLTTTDAAQVEAALRACRETGVSPVVTSKVSQYASTVRKRRAGEHAGHALPFAHHTLVHACD